MTVSTVPPSPTCGGKKKPYNYKYCIPVPAVVGTVDG